MKLIHMHGNMHGICPPWHSPNASPAHLRAHKTAAPASLNGGWQRLLQRSARGPVLILSRRSRWVWLPWVSSGRPWRKPCQSAAGRSLRSEQGAGEVEGEEAMEVAGRLWAVPAEAWEAAGVAGAVALKALAPSGGGPRAPGRKYRLQRHDDNEPAMPRAPAMPSRGPPQD